MKVLVTGAAGFIGYHLCQHLLKRGDQVIAIDCLHHLPYGTKIKMDRIKNLDINVHIQDCGKPLPKEAAKVDAVCHLAALAGVRHSIDNPIEYITHNIMSFSGLLDQFRDTDVNFVYASSSSVYGADSTQPFDEAQMCNKPISLYAATKKSDELIAHAYHTIYGMNLTGLRFFSVYGPWGRPDMALLIFAHKIKNSETLRLYNNGKMARDWTYIDDIVDGITRCIDNPTGYEVYNIGYGQPQPLESFVQLIEQYYGKKAKIEYMPIQKGDIVSSHADITKISALGYNPSVHIIEGIPKTMRWFEKYYG